MWYLNKSRVAQLVLAFGVMGLVFVMRTPRAHAAACAPSADFGTVSFTSATGNPVSIPGSGAAVAYKIWSRMAIQNTTDNNYLLEVDGNCYTVTDTGAVTASLDQSSPTNINWTWVSTSLNLAPGNHDIKLVGNGANVAVDRLLFIDQTAASPCVPAASGNGDDCTADTFAPTVSITSPAANATVTGTVNISATANDNAGGSGVKQVQFYLDNSTTALPGTVAVSGSTYSLSWAPTSALNGSHTIKAVATDNSNNSSNATLSVTVNIAATRKPGDANNDNAVGPADFSILNNNWGKTTGISFSTGDFNGDNAVGPADFSILNNNWGR